MDRRAIIRSALVAGAGVTAVGVAAPAPAATPRVADATPKIVYHLSDVEKVMFVIGNLHNHIEGMGGPDKVVLALVVHGPPLRSFRTDTKIAGLKGDLDQLRQAGVAFYACIHTMQGMGLTLAELLPGFAVAEKGGVVKLAQLQAEGWLYLRP